MIDPLDSSTTEPLILCQLGPISLIHEGFMHANLHRTNPACAGQSVVFVTVTAPEVTKTVSVPYEKENAAAVETSLAVSQTSILTDVTTTLTSYVTFTEFFTVAPAPPTPSGSGQVAADKGPYYFSENDGTLEWLDGKTPPATGSFHTVTTFITVQPVPTNSPALVEESTVATTYSTVSLYSVITVYRTKVTTSTIRIPAIPVKVFINPGSAGWNTSYTPPLKGGKYRSVSGKPRPTVWQTGATPVSGQLEARQVGAVVVATINGAVVSWINSYDGKPTVNSVTSCIDSPASSPVAPGMFQISLNSAKRLTRDAKRINWRFPPPSQGPFRRFPLCPPDPSYPPRLKDQICLHSRSQQTWPSIHGICLPHHAEQQFPHSVISRRNRFALGSRLDPNRHCPL